MDNYSGEVFSLWIGKQSQQCAHHFYALQAEQFFDQNQDPTNHSSIWKMNNIHGDIKTPYALIMDVQIPHLVQLRKVNHKKMLKQMDKKVFGLEQMYFPISYKKKEQQKNEQQEGQQDSYLYQNWESRQQNYIVIDKNYNQENQSYQFWQQMYKNQADNYEDRIRKKLQYFDYLQCMTLVSDRQRSGFSFQVVQHLRDACHKKELFFLDINSKIIQEGQRKQDTNWIASQAEISPMSDFYCSINNSVLEYQYFETNKFQIKMAPLINGLFTPFFLKNSHSTAYASSLITNRKKNLFNIAFTLPIIKQKKLELSQKTNIFKYLQQQKAQKQSQSRQKASKKQQNKNKQQQKQEDDDNLQQEDQNSQPNHLNYSFDYLIYQKLKQKKEKQKHIFSQTPIYSSNGLICESYILKGHIDKLQNHFQPRTKLLSMKYLEGILCNYKNQVMYDKFYQKEYGKVVENYPFHLAMFQHQQFGPFLRNAANDKYFKINHQMFSEWKQCVLEQGDLYKQLKNQDSD